MEWLRPQHFNFVNGIPRAMPLHKNVKMRGIQVISHHPRPRLWSQLDHQGLYFTKLSTPLITMTGDKFTPINTLGTKLIFSDFFWILCSIAYLMLQIFKIALFGLPSICVLSVYAFCIYFLVYLSPYNFQTCIRCSCQWTY